MSNARRPKLKTMTYWVAVIENENDGENLRARTRKEVVEMVRFNSEYEYTKPRKMSVTYRDAFDLLHAGKTPGDVHEGWFGDDQEAK